MTYKVWVTVEMVDEEKDEYMELDSPFASTAEFDTEEEAQQFALTMHRVGEVMDESKEQK